MGVEALAVGELVFVGLGLFDERDISLRGLEEVKRADFVFAEFYTGLMAGFSMENFSKTVGKEVAVVSRRNLEDENGEIILKKAERAKVAFLVAGDPLVATTHVDLRIQAETRGIKTRIVHGASIISAVVGLSGLQNYRFGRSVTIPFADGGFMSETPYNVVTENKSRSLHTLCFLDVRAEENRYMTIKEALTLILASEERRRRQGTVTEDSLAIGIARAGAEDATVKAESVRNLLAFDFGAPPHILIFSADALHFMEAEALIRFAHAPKWTKEMIK